MRKLKLMTLLVGVLFSFCASAQEIDATASDSTQGTCEARPNCIIKSSLMGCGEDTRYTGGSCEGGTLNGVVKMEMLSSVGRKKIPTYTHFTIFHDGIEDRSDNSKVIVHKDGYAMLEVRGFQRSCGKIGAFNPAPNDADACNEARQIFGAEVFEKQSNRKKMAPMKSSSNSTQNSSRSANSQSSSNSTQNSSRSAKSQSSSNSTQGSNRTTSSQSSIPDLSIPDLERQCIDARKAIRARYSDIFSVAAARERIKLNQSGPCSGDRDAEMDIENDKRILDMHGEVAFDTNTNQLTIAPNSKLSDKTTPTERTRASSGGSCRDKIIAIQLQGDAKYKAARGNRLSQMRAMYEANQAQKELFSGECAGDSEAMKYVSSAETSMQDWGSKCQQAGGGSDCGVTSNPSSSNSAQAESYSSTESNQSSSNSTQGDSGSSTALNAQQNGSRDHPIPDSSKCMTFKSNVRGSVCNSRDSLEVEMVNSCSEPISMHLCVFDTERGKWTCGSSTNSVPGETVIHYSCHSDGRYLYSGCSKRSTSRAGGSFRNDNCGGDPNVVGSMH